MRQLGRRHRLNTQEAAQDNIGGFVQEPDGRRKNNIEDAQRPDQTQGDRDRISDRDVFRGQFAEDNVQESDADEGERDRNRRDKSVRMNVDQREERLQNMHEKLFADPAEREAGQRDAELRGRKIGVEMRAHVLDETGPQIPLFHQFVELTGAHFDDGEFARHEETVENDERGNGGKFGGQNHGRIPMLRDRFSQRRCREK